MKYETIIQRCKTAFQKDDLESASKYWCKMYNKLEREEAKLDKDNYDRRRFLFREFSTYISQFTDEEVYTITDYLKEKYYESENK